MCDERILSTPSFSYKAETRPLELTSTMWCRIGVMQWFSTLDVQLEALKNTGTGAIATGILIPWV